MIFLAFIVAAAMGAAVRYGASVLWDTSGFPGGQLLVNTVGSLGFGIALFLFTAEKLDPAYKPLILIAFLGSMTTFSTYSASALQFLQRGQVNQFFLLVFVTNVFAITGCWLGYFLSSRWIG